MSARLLRMRQAFLGSYPIEHSSPVIASPAPSPQPIINCLAAMKSSSLALGAVLLSAACDTASAFSVASSSRPVQFVANQRSVTTGHRGTFGQSLSTTNLSMSAAVDEATNTLTVAPIKSLDGTVTLPGSKSLSNRCLLLAALSDGKTKVENLLESDDIRYMLEALDQMKVPVERDPNDPTAVTVTGQAGPINSPLGNDETCELFLGNAGTAMRPLAAALCMGKGKFVLDGVPRMRERPIADLIDGLQQLGADVTCVEETGCPPVTIDANGLKGGKVCCIHFGVFVPEELYYVLPR